MSLNVVTPGNLGTEFDFGIEETGKIHVKTDETLIRDPVTGELGIDAAYKMPPYVAPIDNGKKLSVKSDGSGLEWVGPNSIVAQLAPVLDNTITLPPATPNNGDSYIVPAIGAQADWIGNENKIATYDIATGTWLYYTPSCNDITTIQTGINAGKAYKWDCALDPDAWSETVVPVLPSTTAGIVFSSGKTIESDTGGIFIYGGDIFAWGSNNSGINGATLENSIHSVVPSKYKMDGSLVSYEPEFVDVWYNTQNAYYLDSNGFIWAQGKNSSRQLGYSGYAAGADLTIPTLIPFFANGNIKIKKVIIPIGAAGTMGVFAISTTGTVYAWGENSNGQLGLGNTTDVADPTILSITDVIDAKFSSEAGNSGYLLKADGTLWATGLNTSGQLGLGNTTNRNTWIQTNSNVNNFDTFSIAALVVKNDGTLWGCGGNSYGILGQGNTTQQTAWIQCRKDAGTFVTDAKEIVLNQGSGAEYGFVITQSNKILVCGRNSQYNLGLNDATQRNYYVEPTISQAPFQGLVKSVVLTGNLNPDAYVLTTSGEVWSAGRNVNGNRGIGNVTAPSASNGLGIWTKMSYPAQIINIKGMGLDNNTYIATSIYALDIDGNIYTHGHQYQVATDGIVNATVYAPMLAPTPYKLAGDNSGTVFSGSTALASGVSGLVPAPMIADESKFLKGDGTWASPANNMYIGNADPNLASPVASPTNGDFYLWTDDGTASGVPQSTWLWNGSTWVQITGFATNVSVPCGSVRTYYPLTTALQERWATGVVTAGAIAGWGLTAVGAGANIIPYSAAGAMFNGYGLIDLGATEPVQATTFTAPASYIRHEIAITPGADNAYFIQVINEAVRDPVLEVWICDPATGVPLPNGRLMALCADTSDIQPLSQSYWRDPQNAYGIVDAYRQWITWLIPQSVIDTYKTGTNTIKLAVRPGLSNGGANRIYISGFAMAKADYQFSYTPYLSYHWTINETVVVAGSGGNDPTGWQISGGIYNGYVPNGQNRTFRIPITDVTKDIYLTSMGLYRPSDNVDGADHCLHNCYFTIKHGSGDVALGRPRLDIYAPGSEIVEQGYRPMGWIIPAATLAAKVSTPAGSIIPYLSVNIDVPSWMINNGHFAGFITESV